MAYVTQNFYSGQKLTDEHMKHIEAGISTADANATKALDIAQKDHATLPPEIAGKADNWMIEEETGLAYLTSGGKKISSGIMIPNDGSGVGGSGSAGTPYAVQYVFQKLTDEQKEQARENIGAGNAGQINLKKYGITEGNIDHKAPYSSAEWEQAYNNFEGIKTALADMAANGQTNIVLPKGTYVVCYQNPNGKEFFLNYGWEIVIPSHVTFDLNGSTIRVIFDSDNRNPYDKSTLDPYKLNGTVFAFSKSYHSTICNGILLGDRYERSYTAKDDERKQEQTYGIKFTKGSEHCTVLNMDISGFMGDAITGDGNHDPDKGGVVVSGTQTYTSLFLDGSGAEKAGTGYSFVSDYHDLTPITSVGGNVMTVITNIGYVREYNAGNNFTIFFYDENKTFLVSNVYDHLDNIPIPLDAKYCRLMTQSETAYAEGATTLEVVYQITPPPSQFVTVSHCTIFNNNRGGMSNLPNDVTIEKCELYENGTKGTENWPEFWYSTRYAINCEDTVCRKIVIKDNYIHDGSTHCLLLAAKYALVEGNRIINFGVGFGGQGLVAYHVKNVVFINNWVEKAASPEFADSITNRKGRYITVTNNYFKNCNIKGDDNTIFGDNVIISDRVNVSFKNTKPAKGFVIEENPGANNNVNVLSYLMGTFKESSFVLHQKNASTSSDFIVLGEKSSDVSIEYVDDAKNRPIVLNKVYGATIVGGEWIQKGEALPEWKAGDVANSTLKPYKDANYTNYYSEVTIVNTFKDSNIIIDENFTANRLIYAAANANATKYRLTLEFDGCTFDVYKNLSQGLVYLYNYCQNKDVIVTVSFKNCTFNNHTENTVGVVQSAGFTKTESNYSLTWEGNTLNGNWTEPQQLS